MSLGGSLALSMSQSHSLIMGVELRVGVSQHLVSLARLHMPGLVSPSHGFCKAFFWALEREGWRAPEEEEGVGVLRVSSETWPPRF